MAEQTLATVDLAKIKPASDNPRKSVGDVKELAASITSMGVLEPLIVVKNNGDGDYTLVAGSRRLAAAKMAKLAQVPVIVREMDEQQRLEAMLVENLQRLDLTPVEEAEGFKRLVDEFSYTQRKLAERIGKSQSHVSKRLGLLALPKDVVQAITDGKLDLAKAVEFERLTEPKMASVALSNLRDQPMRDVKMLVDQLNNETVKQKAVAETKELCKKNKWHFVENVWSGGAVQLPDEDIKITLKAHEKLPCFGLHVAGYGGGRVEIAKVCIDPDSHLPEGEKPERASGTRGKAVSAETLAAKEEKRKALEKRLRIRNKEREAFLAEIVGRRLPAQVRAQMVCGLLIDSAGIDAMKAACKLLGLDPVKDPKIGLDTDSYRKPVKAFASKSDENLWRAATAVYLGFNDVAMTRGYMKDRVQGYVKVISKLGWKLDADEKDLIENGAPRPPY